jgi:hypothetical protein
MSGAVIGAGISSGGALPLSCVGGEPLSGTAASAPSAVLAFGMESAVPLSFCAFDMLPDVPLSDGVPVPASRLEASGGSPSSLPAFDGPELPDFAGFALSAHEKVLKSENAKPQASWFRTHIREPHSFSSNSAEAVRRATSEMAADMLANLGANLAWSFSVR